MVARLPIPSVWVKDLLVTNLIFTLVQKAEQRREFKKKSPTPPSLRATSYYVRPLIGTMEDKEIQDKFLINSELFSGGEKRKTAS